MHLTEAELLLSATDLAAHHACAHLTQLDLDALRTRRVRPESDDAMLALLSRRGDDHERRHLERLRSGGLRVVEIARVAYEPDALRDAELLTVEAMRGGADVIYQATFFHDGHAGFADFLHRVAHPSELGPFGYEVHDTKLAAHVKVDAILQVCDYSAHVARLQGVVPKEFALVLGDNRVERLRTADHMAYYRAARQRLDADLNCTRVTIPEPCSHCGVCRWKTTCAARWRSDDALVQVAGITAAQRGKLMVAGITTMATLAESKGAVAQLATPTLERLRSQARLQVSERSTGFGEFELLEPSPGLGLARLPQASPGDLFFDIEGDPLWDDGGLEYLLGVVGLGQGDPPFLALWAHDREQERASFERFIDLVVQRRTAVPEMHIYHYAAYEVSAMKRLAARHGTREVEVDELLRGEAFVDLLGVVRQGLRISKDSYSLKSIEKFFMPRRDGDVKDAGASVVEYERWILERDQSILDSIEAYNRFDCISTARLRDWLEQRRAEAEVQWAMTIARPEPSSGEANETTAAADAETERLAAPLLDGGATDARPDGHLRARTLLGHLLSFHRREDRSQWWDYFAHHEMSIADLIDDPDSIGGVRHVGHVGVDKRSAVHRFEFDPTQEHRVRADKAVIDPTQPAHGNAIGTVVSVGHGHIDIKMRNSADPDSVASLFPWSIVGGGALIDSLRRLASWVGDNGIDAPGAHRAARDLLLRRPPRLRGVAAGEPLIGDGETPGDAAVRLVTRLEGGTLAIQGPPGSGKTYTAALMAAELIRAGRVVGICAPSHRAVSNLLKAVLSRCDEDGITVSAVQKVNDSVDAVADSRVRQAKDNGTAAESVRGGTRVVAGTAWLFASEEMRELVDVLFVDEAGQMSLANTIGAAGAAMNLILLGDPQQLPQVLNGSHPEGAASSALGHVLGEQATMEPERGLFLAETRRLHPTICAFVSEMFYDSRLCPFADCSRLNIDGAAGLRFMPVAHMGCAGASAEEAEVVRDVVDALIGQPWTDNAGKMMAVTAADILVVTPFNAQVELLAEILPAGVEAGTVDKFQGREGAAVIYTMACSTVDDAPRGVDFLYELNRLNVAVSRARALAVVVASPELLNAQCTHPRQVPRVNALCRFAELAAWVEPGGDPLN